MLEKINSLKVINTGIAAAQHLIAIVYKRFLTLLAKIVPRIIH